MEESYELKQKTNENSQRVFNLTQNKDFLELRQLYSEIKSSVD